MVENSLLINIGLMRKAKVLTKPVGRLYDRLKADCLAASSPESHAMESGSLDSIPCAGAQLLGI